METETRNLAFGITGEFITKIAREWFFIENKPYSVIEDLLLSCMCGTDTPEGKLKLMAQDVLLGRAEFRGNSWDGSFVYVTLDEPAKTNIMDEYIKAQSKIKKLEESLDIATQKYISLLDALRMWYDGDLEDAVESIEDHEVKDLVIDLMALHDQVLLEYSPGYGRRVKFPDSKEEIVVRKTTGEPLLDSFFAQNAIEEKHKDNYGWLEPDGTFHPADWCEHQQFAWDEIQKRGWEEDFDRFTDTERGNGIYRCGDYLTYMKGWVLLHNPGRGVAYVTRDENKRLTKAQREFLFNYYFDRGEKAKAAEFLEDT